MNTLPTCLEKIIYDYKYQLEKSEHQEKFNPVLLQIKRIGYLIDFMHDRQLKITFKKTKKYQMYITNTEVIVNLSKIDVVAKDIRYNYHFMRY